MASHDRPDRLPRRDVPGLWFDVRPSRHGRLATGRDRPGGSVDVPFVFDGREQRVPTRTGRRVTSRTGRRTGVLRRRVTDGRERRAPTRTGDAWNNGGTLESLESKPTRPHQWERSKAHEFIHFTHRIVGLLLETPCLPAPCLPELGTTLSHARGGGTTPFCFPKCRG